MAGGTGGAGGSPYGVAGLAGATEPQGTVQNVDGGTGGDNGYILYDGPTSYGPYGAGGAGGSVINAGTPTSPADAGNDGGVILVWGGGNYGITHSLPPQTIYATSPGVGTGGGGPRGNPGTQYSTSNGNAASSNYAPVSKYWVASSTSDSSFAWSRALAFVSSQTTVTQSEMQSWGFDPSDVASVSRITLDSFSAGVDTSFSVGWATIAHGSSNIASAGNFTLVADLSDSIPDRHFRSSDNNPYSSGTSPYGLGPWNIPIPDVNHLLYIWVQDGSGSDTRTITVTYTV